MAGITLEAARRLLDHGAKAAAADYGQPVCIAVVDGHGDLVAFLRQDGAPVRSVAIAQGKAYSAVRLGVDTNAFLERLQRERIQASDFCDSRLTALPGGSVIRNGAGAVIGAVGVSGLKTDQDQALAGGMAALLAAGPA
jgi:uncharacterized protein GlcG (DUF336 family)